MCFLLKVLNMFSVEGTQCVFCCRYSMCFLLKVLNMFSVFCCRYSVLNLFSFSVVGLNLFSVFC